MKIKQKWYRHDAHVRLKNLCVILNTFIEQNFEYVSVCIIFVVSHPLVPKIAKRGGGTNKLQDLEKFQKLINVTTRLLETREYSTICYNMCIDI